MALCRICEEKIESDHGRIQSAGLQSIIDISNEVDDGLAKIILEKPLPIPIHTKCRRTYTTPSTIAAKKRKREESNERDGANNIRCVRRSQVSQYNPYTDCLYCTKAIPFFQSCSKDNRDKYDYKLRTEYRGGHCAETIEIPEID